MLTGRVREQVRLVAEGAGAGAKTHFYPVATSSSLLLSSIELSDTKVYEP